MTRKVLIILGVLGILLFAVIVLHILFTFYSFTLFGLEEEQYKVLVSDAILVLAFGFALVPVFQVSQNTRKLRQEISDFLTEHGITINPVKKKGKDDLEWMLPHYQQAGHVTIFAGSFDWLGENKQMKQRIRQLAAEDHLKLDSYKSERQVEEAFQRKNEEAFFAELKKHFRFDTGLEGVTCTMIQKLGADWEFLYRSRADAENAFNVCYLSTTPRNIELLHILSQLTEAQHWGKPAGNPTQTKQG